MSNKIPCGGFYVGDGLNVDENGVLSTGSGVGNVIVEIKGTGVDTYVADKSFDDIKAAIKDGKYVSVYYVDEDEYYQLTDEWGNLLRFSRATPYRINQFDIHDSNKIDYQESDLDGSKNWLLSFDEKGRTTPVESLDYIKLKSPNGTLYTISVTDNGTIQANAGS